MYSEDYLLMPVRESRPRVSPTLGVATIVGGLFFLCTICLPVQALCVTEWKANFIWTHRWGEEQPLYKAENLFIMFRKTFELRGEAAKASGSIFCDGRYILYINGRYVGRGPTRHEGYRYYYDEFDISQYLNSGKNVVAVLARSFGEQGTGWYYPAVESVIRGSLIFQADIELSGGSHIEVVSDRSWRFRRAEAWAQDTPRTNGNLPSIELYDANLETERWTQADFDDSNWMAAALISSDQGKTVPPMEPYYLIRPRQIPLMREEIVWPKAVVASGETACSVFGVQALESLSDLAKRTRVEPHYPASSFKFQALDTIAERDSASLTIERISTFENVDGAGYVVPPHLPFVIFDFGREVVGYLRLDVDASSKVTIDVALGETLIDGRVDATEPAGNYVARYITKPGKQSWERFDWLGFRYVQLTFRNLETSIRVKPSLNFVTYPVSNRGRFECSDPLLNRIAEVARYTLQTNTWDSFMDVPNREQRQWIGDGELNILAHYATHGDLPIVQKLLDDTAYTQRSDGILRKYAGGRNEPGKNTELILDYNFSWTRALADYYLYTGDLERIRDLYPTLVKNIAWFLAFAGKDGLLGSPPARLFLDFSAPDYRGKSAGYNAQFFGTLKRAAFLAREVGDTYRERMWEEAAARIKESFDSYFWDDEKGLYVDAWQNGQRSPYVGQFTNGVVLLYGLMPWERVNSVLEKIFDSTRVREWSGHGRLSDPPPRPPGFDVDREIMKAQPYGAYFMLRGLARAGRYDLVIKEIRESWGKLIAQGATTFWGNWDRNNTFDAAWGSSVLYIFATDILGIRPVEPGFRVFAVEPHAAGLDWARGSFPSVMGDIPVSWTFKSGELRLQGVIPEGTTAEILLPRTNGIRPREVWLDGQIVWKSSKVTQVTGIRWAREEENGVRLCPSSAGKYEVTAVY